jgi:regulator of cell morphogenesis and NO signaling
MTSLTDDGGRTDMISEMPTLDQTVADIVLEHSACARVFQKHRIDFCCRGERTVRDAAAERGVDPKTLLAELDDAVSERLNESVDPRSLSNAALVGHIVARHHDYLRKALPFIAALSAKVARVHGDHNPKLRTLDVIVKKISGEIEPHLDVEEQVMFPAVLGGRDRAEIVRTLRSMHMDHLVIGELLSQLRDAADDFRLPEWACNSYRTLFAELEALEADILRHVHLENHVLMPRFIS